jgi:hypothetical protein
MVLYRSRISCWWRKYPGIPILSLCAPLAYGNDPAMTRPKSQISKIEHDGTLSIRNLMLIRTQKKLFETVYKFHVNFKCCPIFFSKYLIHKIWISASDCKMSEAKRAYHSVVWCFLHHSDIWVSTFSMKSLQALMRFLKETFHPGTDFREMLEIENS